MALTNNAIDTAITGAFGVLDDLITTPEEKAQIQLQFVKVREAAKMAQINVNSVSAQHKSLFVAGGRPAIMWICAFGFGYEILMLPIINTIAFYLSVYHGFVLDLDGLPRLDTDVLMVIMTGLLGMGGWRTLDKIKGVQTDALNRKANANG